MFREHEKYLRGVGLSVGSLLPEVYLAEFSIVLPARLMLSVMNLRLYFPKARCHLGLAFGILPFYSQRLNVFRCACCCLSGYVPLSMNALLPIVGMVVCSELREYCSDILRFSSSRVLLVPLGLVRLRNPLYPIVPFLLRFPTVLLFPYPYRLR